MNTTDATDRKNGQNESKESTKDTEKKQPKWIQDIGFSIVKSVSIGHETYMPCAKCKKVFISYAFYNHICRLPSQIPMD